MPDRPGSRSTAPAGYRECGRSFRRPLGQRPFARLRVIARSDQSDVASVAALRQAVRRIDPNLVPDSAHDIEAEVRASAGEPRFYTVLLSTIAGVALLLAMIGVFASMSYRVARRLREVGIRTALGLAIGFAAAWYSTRYLESLVYGIGTHDPLTFLGAACLLFGTAALACYLPARRAASVDPVCVLRNE